MDDWLGELERGVDRLLSERDEARREAALLREEVEREREEIMRSHEEVIRLRREVKELEVANELLGSEEKRDEVRKELGKMIGLVDKALEELKVER